MLWLTLAFAELPSDALTALRRGDCGVALTALEGVEGLEAEVARSRCGAPSQLRELLGDGSVIDGYARLLVARELVESEPVEAEALLKEWDGELNAEHTELMEKAAWAQARLDVLSDH